MTISTLKYQSQSVSKLYFIAAMALFAGQIIFGIGLGLQYVIGDFLFPYIPFNQARMVHTNLLIVWLLFGFMGAAYYMIPEEAETELHSPLLAKVLFWVFLVAGALTIVGYLAVPYAKLAELTGNDLLQTMGREFLEQPLPTKIGIVVVALGFLYNISMTVLKGRKTSISVVLLMGLWGLALFFLFSFVNPHNLVRDKMYWWFVVHLWVEGVWELILGALLAYVLVKTTGVDREVIDKWLYVIIAFALMTGILGHRPPFLLHRPAGLLAVGGQHLQRDGTDTVLHDDGVRLQHGAASPARPSEPGRHPVGRGYLGDGLPRRRPVGLHPHAQPGELLHPRHAGHRGARPSGLLRRLRAGGHRADQLCHADAARAGEAANSPKAQSVEMWSFWVMTIGMAIMVLAMTGAGVLQVWLQRMPTEGAMGFMATQDQLRFFYWTRVGGGVVFLIGQFAYFASFFIGGDPVLSDDAAPAKGAPGCRASCRPGVRDGSE
jgi:nitric oxide reductase subunit B